MMLRATKKSFSLNLDNSEIQSSFIKWLRSKSESTYACKRLMLSNQDAWKNNNIKCIHDRIELRIVISYCTIKRFFLNDFKRENFMLQHIVNIGNRTWCDALEGSGNVLRQRLNFHKSDKSAIAQSLSLSQSHYRIIKLSAAIALPLRPSIRR